nr:unnamed protein product [Spirometra erinaceieuropaei]
MSNLYSSYGQGVCTWSQRLIPKNSTGNIAFDLPVLESYWRGYLGNETFWTYPWARGWCSYKQGYFRCPYITRDDRLATQLMFPDAENISYIMLRDTFPITIHKAEDETIPGFYIEEGTKLNLCPQTGTVQLFWTFNGNESDLQDISCYTNERLLCSGLQTATSANDDNCKFHMRNGRVTVGYQVYKEVAVWTLYYCHANKEQTITLTYIVDWEAASNQSISVTGPVLMAPSIVTSGTKRVMGSLWMFVASWVCISW